MAIINPQAGALRFRRFRERWLPVIESAVATLRLTTAAGEAARLAETARDFDGIAVAGGDGTVYEVLAGIDRSRQRLAVLPAGRGNNLARELGIPGMAEAIGALSTGRPRRIDLIGVEVRLAGGGTLHRLAASTLATGYLVTVVRRAEAFRLLGRLAYAWTTPFVRPQPAMHVLAYDDGPAESRVLTGLVINNTRYLANAEAFPDASLADGRLDIMELTAGWGWQTLHNLSILAGHAVARGCRQRSAAVAAVRLPEPTTLLVDGEMIAGVAAFTARCLPGGLICQEA
jgi:diacylglycerol kinase family enzyme